MNPSKKNLGKWFYAFLIVTVALIAAVTILIINGVNSNSGGGDTPPPQEQPQDGPESGVYYYDVAGGEILLSLNSGNKFTIAGPDINKSGDYTVNGTTINLDFIRDEDGTAVAMFNGDTVTLSYNDSTMTFLKKVYFTVSFETDGGSAIAPVTVLNGKTVAKPNDPTKSDGIFLGWYSDAQLTSPFSFDTETVKSDVTVYAKWAKTVLGQSEHTVKLSLNYDGAAELEDMITAGGKLYGLPSPERTGYTFMGWYVSMYEDGNKLTYAYTEDTVITSDTTLFAVWSDESSTTLRAPSASVNASSVSWDAVDGANRYQIKIIDENGNVITDEPIGTTTYTVNFDSMAAGDYVIEITAIAPDTSKNSAPAVRCFKNKALDRVSSFQVIDNVLIFGVVDNAEKYLITVECGNASHNHTNFDNGTSTAYNFSNCYMMKGGIKFTVTAMANGYSSSVSRTFVYDRTLSAIDDLVYNAESDSFVWSPVDFAASYTVTLTADGKTYAFDNGNKTKFSVAHYTGDIKIEVTPVTAGYNSPDAASSECKKTTPPVPTGLSANGMLLTWNAVEGATSYEIKIGSQTFNSETNSFDISNASLTTSTTHLVSVKSVKGAESSAYSEPVTVAYLVMDPALTYSGNTVYWTPVIGATVFEVRVNGGVIKTVNETNCAKVVLTKAGINTIEVRYADQGGSDWVSIEVFAFEITYMSRSLSGERTEYVAIGDMLTPPTDFTNVGYSFSGWYNTPSASQGNGILYESFLFTGNSDTVLYADWTPSSYSIEFDTTGYDITNIEEGFSVKVSYTGNYTLPVPTSSNSSFESFVGWYTGPSGSGTKLTDEKGNSLSPYPYTHDTLVYPYFNSNVLSFELRADNTYAVKAGINFDSVSHISIPYTYNDLPVTTILENAFKGHTKMKSIDIPNTIKLVGIGAFSGASALKSINVYEVEGNHTIYYSSHDGALLRHDMGTTYLEIFPRAKTGAYTVSDNVTVIRNKAFQYANINKVIISTSVTEIQDNSFWMCNNLASVEFAEGRTTNINVNAKIFNGCKSITSIKFPANIQEIDISMFKNLPALTSIEVEDGGRFYGSVNGMLTNSKKDTLIYATYTVSGVYTVPQAINYIGPSAFEARNNITEIVIPTNVLGIGEKAFSKCTGLTKVTIEGKRLEALSIGNSAFENCEKLKTVTFGGSGTDEIAKGAITIGNNAFAFTDASKTPNLQNVIFEDGVNIFKIGTSAFEGNVDLDNLSFGNNVIVEEIGDYAFKNNILIEHIVIPASTKSIGAGAFEGCTRAKSVTFVEGGNEISFGTNAFKDCVGITRIELPSSTKKFIGSAFSGCSALSEIVVNENNPYLMSVNGILYGIDGNRKPISLLFYPKALDADPKTISALPWDTITAIGDTAFESNSKLTEFVITDKITHIGDNAFASCSNLEKVTCTGSASSFILGEKAFYRCTKLTSVSLPSTTESIGNSAFESCGFASFDMPESVTAIGEFAFKNNAALTSVDITANITSIGDSAFASCKSLSNVNFAEGGAEITLGKSVFSSCNSISSMDLNSRVTVLPESTFASSGIANLDMTGITRIEAKVFENTNKLETVTIPTSVIYIGNSAFQGSSKLKNVIFTPGGTERLDLGDRVFNQTTSLEEFTFPARIGTVYRYGKWGQWFSSSETEDSNTTIISKNFYSHFYGSKNLKNIFVEDGCTSLCSIDGVIYEKDSKGNPSVLLFCPPMNEGVIENGTPTYTLRIPNTVVMVENFAFQTINKITAVYFEDLDRDNAYYGKPLLSIGNGLPDDIINGNSVFGFSGSYVNTIKTIEFPSHLASLGPGAIRRTSSSITVKFSPDTSDLTICRSAFSNARISSLDLYGVSTLGNGAFAQMNNITSITFTNCSFTTIPSNTFSTSALRSLVIPASVRKIESSALASLNQLKSVSFEEGSQLTTIGSKAFSSYLKTLDLSNATKLSIIEPGAFEKCSGLTSFIFPESIKGIGSGIFKGCTGITSVTIPSSMTADMLFGEDTTGTISIFSDLTNLSEIKMNGTGKELLVEDNVIYSKDKSIIYLFPAKKSPVGFSIPDSVKVIEVGAFRGFSGTEMILPAGLESIGAKAFAESKITAIKIPAGVTYIGDSAFANCRSLTTLEFEEGSRLEVIESSAFQYTFPTSLSLPDSIKEIRSYAFTGNNKLVSLKLPASLESIGNSAFLGCLNITSLTLPEKLQTIGVSAFNSAINLKELHIPASVVSIGDSAFNSAMNLTKLTFAANSRLESIGTGAFKNANELTSVVIPESVNFIGESAFENCAKLVAVTLPSSLSEISNKLFFNDQKLEKINVPDSLTSIGSQAFNNTAITSLNIPNSVTNIGTGAFENCKALKTVIFSDQNPMTTLNDNIFSGTTSLETVELPKGIQTLGTNLFRDSGIMSIILPSSLKTINPYAFYNCDRLSAIAIYGEVTYIGDYAFYDCDELVTADLSFGLEALGSLAFAYCDKLTNAYIPATTSTLGANPFFMCKLISEITVDPDSTFFTVENKAIYDTSKRILYYYPASNTNENVVLPETIREIKMGAFTNAQMKSVTIPANVNSIDDYTFQNCANLEVIIGGDGIKFIGDNAFENCKKLKTITLNEGLTSIGNYAFSGCASLNNIVIPNTALKLGNYAFAGCSSLSSFSFAPTSSINPYVIGTNFFENCTSMTKIILPNYHTLTDEEAVKFEINSMWSPEAVAAKNGAIPSYMFAGTGIIDAVLPKSVTWLGTEGVFMNCEDMISISFSGTLSYEKIGDHYFDGCSTIEQIVIPAGGNTVLSNYTFANCTSLERVALFYKTEPTDGASHLFENCSSLNEIVWYKSSSIGGPAGPRGLKYVGPYFFAGCTSLKSVTLEDGVSIGEYAFDGCTALSTLNIERTDSPAYNTYTIVSIGDYAFRNCTSFKQFTFKNYFPTSVGKEIFAGWGKDQTINLNYDSALTMTNHIKNNVFANSEATVLDKDGNPIEK